MKLVRHPNVVRLHEAWAQNLEYKLYFVGMFAFKSLFHLHEAGVICHQLLFIVLTLMAVYLGSSKPHKNLYNLGIHHWWRIV